MTTKRPRTERTPLEEQETLIGRAGDENAWHVWSTERRMIGKIRRLADRLGITVNSGIKGGEWVEVQFPQDQVRNLVIKSRKRPMKGHLREAARERLRLAREGRMAGRTSS